jgi:ATP-binding cassette subfamily F protein uup
MATLLGCQSVSKVFGTRTLFDGLSISFSDGERVGLLGPNGAGKTTLMRIFMGHEKPSSGEVMTRRSARIAYVPQKDHFPAGATVDGVLDDALSEGYPEDHERALQVDIMRTRLGFPSGSQPVEVMSGGWRKRMAVSREVVREPDLMLLDEPTNHLDLAGIEWLEKLLGDARFTFLAVSHDRYFLESVTNRVVELNPVYPDGYFSVSGNYSVFLEKREMFLEGQQAREEAMANIMRREAAFLKSNSKAQRTKSKRRIEEAYKLQDELKDLHNRNTLANTAGVDFDGTGRKSKKLLTARGVSKTLGDKLLFSDVSMMLSPGSRLGVLGPNGSGKTTFIRVITGKLPPDVGSVDLADNLRIVLFDQDRESLPPDLPLRRALSADSDTVMYRGQKMHIFGWAKRFLFREDQMGMPVKDLSGGEQARILIARLMLQPADVLVLDEPTNDLDIATLDILEESLADFPGAVVLVTHDRFMLDRLCNEFVGLDGRGGAGIYGDRTQWQAAMQAKLAPPTRDESKKSKASEKKGRRNALTASEQKELQDMEATIEEAEGKLADATQARDSLNSSDHEEVQAHWQAVEVASKEVDRLYARWQELEAKAGVVE